MEYNKIIAVAGLPGLYELLSSKSDGAIVRSLDDKTTRFVSSRIHNFSHLESIEVYTVRDNVNLADILKAMEVSTDKLPDDKDAAALKNYFTKVYPDLDFTRVYSSDLKKMVKWFAVLKANNIEIKLSGPEEEEEELEAEVGEEKPATAPAKKAPATKAAATKAAAAKTVPAAKKKVEAEKAPVAEKKAKTEGPAKKEKAAAEKPAPKKAAAKEKTEKTGNTKKAVSKAGDKPKKAAKKK